MAPTMKRPAAAMKRPAAAVADVEVAAPPAKKAAKGKAAAAAAKSGALAGLKAYVINLERRPDRWARVSKMLKKELPWLDFEQFAASDGSKAPIPEEEVAETWNTSKNAHYADYYEYVIDAPSDEETNLKQWKWACEAVSDDTYEFTEQGESFDFPRDGAVEAGASPERTGTVKEIATGKTFDVKLQFAKQYLDPGLVQRMSGGERGCAHSHWRLWKLAASRSSPTLVLEDDVHLTFERSDSSLGMMKGKVFTERLQKALEAVDEDFDVLYLGWSGWRGGHHKLWDSAMTKGTDVENSYARRAEYVWTTVAYVLTPAGAAKLLAIGKIDQPVDNFMAWEASQGRLKSYVAIDEGDDNDTWAGGLVDQFDFQGDSDIKKSDGGHQGDDPNEFVTEPQ